MANMLTLNSILGIIIILALVIMTGKRIVRLVMRRERIRVPVPAEDSISWNRRKPPPNV
jgi:hypothetical protein